MQPENNAGAAILDWASNRPLSARQRGPIGTVARILRDFQMAVSAESMRSVRRADFFWREALRRLETAWPDEALWTDLRQHAPLKNVAPESLDGKGLREAIARELFADSLWALHNGLQSGDDRDKARAIAVIDYLRTLIERTGPLDVARMTAFGAALRDSARRCADAKDWDRAKILASWLVEQCGGEQHENLLGTIIVADVVARLTDSQDETDAKANASRLAEAIQRLDQLQKRARRNPTLLDLLADLHLRLSIQLANSGRLADGLVAVQKSVTYDPALQAARDVRTKLTELMNQLRQDAATLRAKVAATPNAVLNGKGQQIVSEAERGFAPLNAFVESAPAREMSDNVMIAQGAAASRSIGLPDEQLSDEAMKDLYLALNATFHRAERDPARVTAAWRQTIAEVPTVATLDADRVTAWVRNRIMGVTPEPSAAVPIAWPGGSTAIAFTRAPRYRDHEPIAWWLFSPQAIWSKAACAAALVVLCIVTVMFVRDSQNRREREAAFEALRAGRANGEYARVLDAAEAFLSHTLSAPDPREAEVKSAYSEALVRWFTEQSPGPDVDRRAARYRALVLAGTDGGSRQ